MRFDDRLANRQTDSHAFFLRRHEGLEQPAHDVGCNAGAVVRKGRADEARFVARCRNIDFGVGTVLHGIDAIADQVEHHLLDLHFVDQHGRRLRIQRHMQFDPHVVPAQMAKSDGFFDHRVEVFADAL